MKKHLSAGIAAALGLTALVAAPSAFATNLSITAGTHDCVVGTDPTSYNGCSYNAAVSTGGSWFAMGGTFANSLSSNVGLEVGVGTAQTFQGTAPSVGFPLDPDPVTNPGIDQNITAPWMFFSTTQWGVNYSLADILLTPVIGDGSAGTAGTATADMSGWRVAWSEVAEANTGAGPDADFTYDGSNWALDYSTVIPEGDPSGFGGTAYDLHLEGTYTGDIEMVPVPAAVWLFGSGLLGLVGVARRRKAA